jgi:pheromone shutdown protein TraB
MLVDSIIVRTLVALLAFSIGSTLATRDATINFRKYFLQLPRGGSSEISVISRSPNIELEENSWRNELPAQLQKRRGALLKFLMPTGVYSPDGNIEQMCEVYVLGTAHVSKDSCEDVKLLMEHVRPDVLFLELCNQRINILEDLPEMNCNEEGSAKSVGEMTKEIMVHNPDMNKAAALSSVLLSKIQGDYATKLNVTIGGEFREAFNVAKTQHTEFMNLVQTVRLEQSTGMASEDTLEKARASNGCSVVLGDRPVRLTLLRAWETCTLFGKIKLVLALARSSLSQPSEEELREWIESIMNDPSNDILSKSIEDLSRHFPAIKKTIIEERDTYMGCKIIQTARIMGMGSNQDGMRRKIVAVVGAGHCPGIKSILVNEVNRQGSLNVEEELQKVVETKKHKADADADMKTLITDVISMEPVI